MYLRLFIFCLACLLSSPCVISAFARQPAPQKPEIVDQLPVSKIIESPTPTGFDTDPISLFTKAIGLVLVFSLLLYLSLRAYKYLVQGKSAGGQFPRIRVLGSSLIGPKKSLCMVDVLDHLLVLGVTDSQITVLLELPWEKLDEGLKRSLLEEKASTSTVSFSALLKNWSKKT